MTKDKALRLALEALEFANVNYWWGSSNIEKAITAIKVALEEEDEPDAYGYAKRLAEAIWSKHYKTIAPQWEPFDELIGVLTQIDNMTAGLISTPQQEAKDEPVAWMYEVNHAHTCLDLFKPPDDAYDEGTLYPLYTTPPQRKEPEQEPVAWKYDVTYNQDGTVSVALPDGDELRIVLPNQQEPYCWTWDVWVSGGKWRAEYGWEKPTEKVVNLQPLYTAPPQRKPLTIDAIIELAQEIDWPAGAYIDFARAIELAHGIKDNT